MFRDKKFLIEKGMYEGCRADVFYIIGAIYDETMETGIINIQKIEELREYLDKNRNLIGNKDYPIVLTKTIVARIKENFFNVKKEEKIKVQKVECDAYHIPDLLENNSIRKVYANWENKTGVYGIFVNDIVVYIGSTVSSFKSRFLEHRGFIKNGGEMLYLHNFLPVNQKKYWKGRCLLPVLILLYNSG